MLPTIHPYPSLVRTSAQDMLHLVRHEHPLKFFWNSRRAVRDVHVTQDKHQLTEFRHFSYLGWEGWREEAKGSGI
jgi:hypothetical protein